MYLLFLVADILERWKIVGLNRKAQIKPLKFEEDEDAKGEKKIRCTEVQLVLKWGGNLTKLGERQSIQLGRKLRHELYPDAPGGGILRLHSTFRVRCGTAASLRNCFGVHLRLAALVC